MTRGDNFSVCKLKRGFYIPLYCAQRRPPVRNIGKHRRVNCCLFDLRVPLQQQAGVPDCTVVCIAPFSFWPHALLCDIQMNI